MSHTCSTLLLHCIDFRLGKAIKDYLERKGCLGDADLVVVAGAAKNVADPRRETDPEFVLRQIDISKRLHGIKTVILMNHTDCGAYGGKSAFKDESAERARLIEDMDKAAAAISAAQPGVEIKKALAVIRGEEVTIEELD